MFSDPTFWAAVAFVVFVIVVTVWPARVQNMIAEALDKRATAIRDELEEAQRLREEAQKALAESKRKQRDMANEAEEVLERAKAEAQRLRDQAEKDLQETMKRREQSALEKIEQAEANAVQEVRNQAVDLAIAATGKLLRDQLDESKSAALVDNSINEVRSKLH